MTSADVCATEEEKKRTKKVELSQNMTIVT
jgi:hypothetical protein